MAAPPFVSLIPPDLPNMPEVSNTLSQYLRTFSLWCRKGFADKLSASQALPGIMLQASDTPAGATPAVFNLQVQTSGMTTLTPIALASGTPGTPISGLGPTGPAGPAGPAGPSAVSANAGQLARLGTDNLILVTTDATRMPIAGVVNGSNAAAGQVGEVISSNIQGTLTLTTTGVGRTITTISLTAGDWDVSGEVWFSIGTGGATQVQAGISTTSATLPTLPNLNTACSILSAALTAALGVNLPLRTCRVNLTATTTYYLVAQASFPSSGPTVMGNIIARRAR